jgi:hypothetical protein
VLAELFLLQSKLQSGQTGIKKKQTKCRTFWLNLASKSVKDCSFLLSSWRNSAISLSFADIAD